MKWNKVKCKRVVTFNEHFSFASNWFLSFGESISKLNYSMWLALRSTLRADIPTIRDIQTGILAFDTFQVLSGAY